MIEGFNPTIPPNGNVDQIKAYIGSLKPYLAGTQFELIRAKTPSLYLWRDLITATKVKFIYQVSLKRSQSENLAAALTFGDALFAIEGPNESLAPYADNNTREVWNAKVNELRDWSNKMFAECNKAGVMYIGPSLTPIYPTKDEPLTGFDCNLGNAHIYADFENILDKSQAYEVPCAEWQLKCYKDRPVIVTEYGCNTKGRSEAEQSRIILAQRRWMKARGTVAGAIIYQIHDSNLTSDQGYYGVAGKAASGIWFLP